MFFFRQAIFIFLMSMVGYSTPLNQFKVIPLKNPISVVTNKDTPAYQAFALLKKENLSEESDLATEETCVESCREVDLNDMQSAPQTFLKISKPIVLAKVYIQQSEFTQQTTQERQVLPQKTIANNSNSQVPPRKTIYQIPPSRQDADRMMEHAARQPVRYPAGQYQPEPTEDDLTSEEILASLTPEQKTRVSTVVAQNRIDRGIYDVGRMGNRNTEQNPDTRSSGELITGHIKLVGGLALTNTMTMSIHRQENGIIQETGYVRTGDWKYQIQVSSPSGILIGKLYDSEGRLIGRGIQRLSPNAETQKNGPEIFLQPATSAVAGNVRSYYDAPEVNGGRNASTRAPKPITNLKGNLASGFAELIVQGANDFSVEGIEENSFALLRTQAPQHYQTNQIIAAQEKVETFLYPVGMMQALREIVADQRSSEALYANLGKARNEEVTIIWGKVERDGQPIEKAEVSLEGGEDLRPIYFNEFQIPEPKLSATSANGLFAFLGTREGLHSLVARKGLQYIGHANVFVEEGAVAVAPLTTKSQLVPVPVKSFDAFNGELLPAQIQMQSLDFTLDLLTGDDLVHLPPIQRLGFAEVAATNHYVPALYAYNDQQEFLSFPRISYEWLNSVAAEVQKKTTQLAQGQLGTLVGFVAQEEFVVQTWGGSMPENVRIYYFDQTGKILEQNSGIAGGGFIIFNLPDDYQQLSIDLLQSQTTHLRVLPVDQGKVTIHSLF